MDEDAVVSSWDETHAIDPDPNAKYNSYIQDKFEAWFDNPTYDIAFGYLFGDEPAPTSDKNFYVLYYEDDANYSTWTLSEKHISASADATAKEAFVNDLFNNCIYNLSAAEPRGFYKIHDGSESYDVDNARSAYDRWSTVSVGLEKNQLIAAYDAWVSAGATEDVYYGTLINTYFYLLHYDSDGNPAFIQVKCTDTEDTVNGYLATIKASAPSGKKFKTWQYWHADWYEEEGYDYSDDGEKEFYKNLVENPTHFETDADVIDTFNAWKPEPYENRHYGAIYEDDTPTPPGPTPVTTDWYWYLDGTHMHYTTTNGTGRTKVTFDGDLGVDYGSTDVTTVTEVTIDDKISPENLHGLFRRFNSLTKINSFTNLDTSNCTDMGRMFQGCSSLESINVSHFNTSKVKDMSRVFHICEKLESIDVSNFDTQNAEKMYQMFGTCIVITDIKFSSKFVTNKVTAMYEMFSRCEIITSLDISSFDISSVTNADDMFASCHELVTIKTSPTLDFSPVSKGDNMFKYSFKIKGGKGTTNDENHVDKSYAHVDGGTSNPGYFTSSGGPTPPSPTPTPTPPSPGGGDPGGSSSGPSDPTHGPMGDLTKNPLYADTLNETNNIPESKMVSNDTLATTLKSYPENANSPMVNARDDSGNVGYGQWLRVPNTTTWYFLSGSFNQGTGTTTSGFLANGWFNLGWDGQDKWYYFDGAGVMKIGWHQEGNKIYYLQADFSDNWYGKAMTGQQMIGGQIYNFDSNGVLIQ